MIYYIIEVERNYKFLEHRAAQWTWNQAEQEYEKGFYNCVKRGRDERCVYTVSLFEVDTGTNVVECLRKQIAGVDPSCPTCSS